MEIKKRTAQDPDCCAVRWRSTIDEIADEQSELVKNWIRRIRHFASPQAAKRTRGYLKPAPPAACLRDRNSSAGVLMDCERRRAPASLGDAMKKPPQCFAGCHELSTGPKMFKPLAGNAGVTPIAKGFERHAAR